MTKDKAPFRAPNFTYKEMETLIYHLELKPELIRPAVKLNRDGGSARHGVLTVNDKLKLWEEVATDINKIGESQQTGIVRSATDVKRKWNDLKSRVKNKAEDIRQGKLASDKTPLSHLEERVLYLIAKTSHLQGLNGALPPAYHNVIGRRKQDKTPSSSSEPIQNGDIDEPNTDIEANTVEDEADDIMTLKQEISAIVPQLAPAPTKPTATRVPIITFTAPFGKIIQTASEARTNKNLGADCSKKNTEIDNNDLKDDDSPELIEMIYSSQKELKNELKSIKKIMIRISEQKRRRIEQEQEKIQLKKMKLMLKCQKQGVDYDEFIADFM